MTKKLILEHWLKSSKKPLIPTQYLLSAQHWICDIMVEHRDGVIDEFEVKPKGKMLLTDLLPHLHHQLDTLVPDDANGCGFRVFRCTS